jgi:hypothetical protein
MPLLAPVNRRQRCIWLTIHLLGMVGWIGVVAGALALDLGMATWPMNATAVASINQLLVIVTCWVLEPCVAATAISGFVLAQIYHPRWPVWLRYKMVLVALVVTVGAVLLLSGVDQRIYTTPARLGGLLLLCTALVISVIRPEGRTAARQGKHLRQNS